MLNGGIYGGKSARQVVSEQPSVAIYRPQERRRVQTSVYLPEDIHKSVEDLGRLWTELDRAQDPNAKQWKSAEVMRRLIEAGLDGAWGEVGGHPVDEKGWAELISRSVRLLTKK